MVDEEENKGPPNLKLTKRRNYDYSRDDFRCLEASVTPPPSPRQDPNDIKSQKMYFFIDCTPSSILQSKKLLRAKKEPDYWLELGDFVKTGRYTYKANIQRIPKPSAKLPLLPIVPMQHSDDNEPDRSNILELASILLSLEDDQRLQQSNK